MSQEWGEIKNINKLRNLIIHQNAKLHDKKGNPNNAAINYVNDTDSLKNDTGDILKLTACPITNIDSGGDLHDRLAEMGATAILETLKDLDSQWILNNSDMPMLFIFMSRMINSFLFLYSAII